MPEAVAALMIRKSALVMGATGAGLALVLALIAIPYQLSQQIQNSVFGGGINGPSIIQQAYGAGTLSNVVVQPSNNLFATASYYEISFRGASAGSISSMVFAFPNGFNVAKARLAVELNGVDGTISVSGQRITLSLPSPLPSQNVLFYIWFEGIVNGRTVNNQVSITTMAADNSTLDGPTASPVFTLTPVTGSMIAANAVGVNALANNAVTSAKIANNAVTLGKLAAGSVDSSVILDGSITATKIGNNNITAAQISPQFMKHVVLHDDAAGHAAGWTPDGAHNLFSIIDPQVNTTSILISPYCSTGIENVHTGGFDVNYCGGVNAPPGTEFSYLVVN